MMLRLIVVFLMVVGDSLQLANQGSKFYRTFECVKDDQCRRTGKPIVSIDRDIEPNATRKKEHTSLAACRLVCGSTAGLWPIPTGLTSYSKNYVRINPAEINFNTEYAPPLTKAFLSEASGIFAANLQLSCGSMCQESNTTMIVIIRVMFDTLELDWSTKEDYNLAIVTEGNEIIATITASTVYGARHGLETLSQLTAPVVTENDGRGLVILDQASVRDSPVYPHRGLLIDTARNFLPIREILKTIDGLASVKMNVLHWHATDSQSFPLQIKSRPSMALYGAYSPDMVYSPEDLGIVVLYAKHRGVRVILELDSPSHVGAGWEWGPSEGLGNIAVCVNQQPWRDFCIQPPCGQINPVNPNVYEVLRDIYKDILGVMGTKSILHLGGDEVYINCWNATPEVTSVMESRGMGRRMEDFLDLWAEFHNTQGTILDEVKGHPNDDKILWSSALTNPEIIARYLDKNKYVIQTWVESTSEMPMELLRLGYRLIMSTKNAWYLDHGFWGSTKYHSWRDAYNNRIPRTPGVLGGEACMWGEYVNAGGFDSRVWPRAAAVAERLWSDPLKTTTADAEPRLQGHRARLEVRGIHADALTPEWCAQHDRQCM